MTTIEIIKVEGTTDLYCKYPGQSKPQPVYVELDPDTKKVSASYSPEIGNAVPFAVYHGRLLRFAVAQVPTADAINDMMEDLTPLFERIIAGYSEEWDGSNTRGHLTPDAQDASEDIELKLNNFDLFDPETETVSGIDAVDWLENDSNADLGITATTTDAELAALAERIEADTDERMILEDLERELERRREQEQKKAEE